MKIYITSKKLGSKCTYCHGNHPSLYCNCGASYHEDCAQFVNHCVVIGCNSLVQKNQEIKNDQTNYPDFKITFLFLVVSTCFFSALVFIFANFGFISLLVIAELI